MLRLGDPVYKESLPESFFKSDIVYRWQSFHEGLFHPEFGKTLAKAFEKSPLILKNSAKKIV